MLHSLRKRMNQLAEGEAAGESFWTETFNERVRTRLRHAITRTASESHFSEGSLFAEARRLIVEQEGMTTLMGRGEAYDDFDAFFEGCGNDMFPTALEAVILGLATLDLRQARLGNRRRDYAARFVDSATEILRQERVAWEVIEGEMVEMKSKELHTAAVAPALRLLHNSAFSKVDKQYRDALGELADDKPANAITDAGTALQEMLEALGCEGNQLGDLIRSAKAKQLLGAHDNPLVEAVEKSLHWAAADRSQMGDAHHATAATKDDAWLMVHIVGALIVRLAAGTQRTD